MSLSTRKTLQKNIFNILLFVNLKAVFRIKNRLSSEFMNKDKISKKRVPCYVINFSAVAATLLVVAKPNVFLRFMPLNICESLLVQVKV